MWFLNPLWYWTFLQTHFHRVIEFYINNAILITKYAEMKTNCYQHIYNWFTVDQNKNATYCILTYTAHNAHLDLTCGCTTTFPLQSYTLLYSEYGKKEKQSKWTGNRIHSENNLNRSNEVLISYSASPPSMVCFNAMLQRRWDKLCVSAHAVPSPLTTRDTTSSRN